MLSLSVQSEANPKEKSVISAAPWTLVQTVKNILQADTGVLAAKQRLFFNCKELKNSHTLEDSAISKDAMLYMSVAHASEASDVVALYVYGNCSCPVSFEEKIHQARQGLAAGLAPRLATEGTGGTYFLRSARQQRNVVVFKPADEEPFAPENPRGFAGTLGSEGLKPGILSGEGHIREVAAFLLDHDHFAGVPATVLAELTHPALNHRKRAELASENNSAFKVGSLQDFVEFDDMVSDMAPQNFKPHQVHKIAILDIRIVNTDRNDANILVKRKAKGLYDLIPIDHAYCLPDTLQLAWTDWVWYDWPQAKIPLDEETKNYVHSLDINRDIELLRKNLPIREPCLRLMRITNMLLQKGVAAGLTLYQIASIILRRDDESKPSELEVMCSQASEIAHKLRDSVVVSSLSVAENSAHKVTLHRSISHTNFQKVDSSMSKRGFLFSSLDGKRQRRKLSVGPRFNDRPTYNDQPDSPDVCSSSQSFKFPATGDIFFHFLDRLMDQVVMLWASKNPPQVSLTASPVLTGACLRSPHPSSFNTGFDFCGFTDSVDSPMLASLANNNQPTPLALDSPPPITTSSSNGVARNGVISSSAIPVASSRAVASLATFRPRIAVEPPDRSVVAAPALPPLPSAPVMATPKVVYRPPHLRGAAQANRSFPLRPSFTIVTSPLPLLPAEGSPPLLPPPIDSPPSPPPPADAVRALPLPQLSSPVTPPLNMSPSPPKCAPSSCLSSPSVSPSLTPPLTSSHISSAPDSTPGAPSSPGSFLSQNSVNLKFSPPVLSSPMHSLSVTSLPPHSLASTLGADASLKRTVLSSISEGAHHRASRRGSRGANLAGWVLGSTSVSARSSLRASAPPFIPLAAKGMSHAQA